MIRSQTLLVLVLVAMVIWLGTSSVVSEDAAGTPEPTPEATAIATVPAPTATLPPRFRPPAN